MKQNITLNLDKDLIKKAKVISAKKDTSISKLLEQELRELVESAESYEAVKRCAIANLRTGWHLGSKIKVSRDKLHER